jgi:hypothetical protein
MIPKSKQLGARLIVLACVAAVAIGSILGLIWMSLYAVK